MKRICIFLISLLCLQSCSLLFSAYEPQQKSTLATFLDFRPYTSEGFFISPDPYSGEHETLGQLFIEIIPEEKEIRESERTKYDSPHYANGLLYGYEHITFAEVLEQAVQRASSIGADGIADMKITKETSGISVRYVATGLCIKRK